MVGCLCNDFYIGSVEGLQQSVEYPVQSTSTPVNETITEEGLRSSQSITSVTPCQSSVCLLTDDVHVDPCLK